MGGKNNPWVMLGKGRRVRLGYVRKGGVRLGKGEGVRLC